MTWTLTTGRDDTVKHGSDLYGNAVGCGRCHAPLCRVLRYWTVLYCAGDLLSVDRLALCRGGESHCVDTHSLQWGTLPPTRRSSPKPQPALLLFKISKPSWRVTLGTEVHKSMKVVEGKVLCVLCEMSLFLETTQSHVFYKTCKLPSFESYQFFRISRIARWLWSKEMFSLWPIHQVYPNWHGFSASNNFAASYSFSRLTWKMYVSMKIIILGNLYKNVLDNSNSISKINCKRPSM